jgi:hypothetical protein
LDLLQNDLSCVDSSRAFRSPPRVAMSALGQKQTFAVQKDMSALHPKADIGAAQINVG